MANDSDTAGDYDLFAGDTLGWFIGAATATLQPNTAVARMLDEWMAVPNSYVGQVIINSRVSSRPPSVTALRFTGGLPLI